MRDLVESYKILKLSVVPVSMVAMFFIPSRKASGSPSGMGKLGLQRSSPKEVGGPAAPLTRKAGICLKAAESALTLDGILRCSLLCL